MNQQHTKPARDVKRGDCVKLSTGAFVKVTRDACPGFWPGSVFIHHKGNWSCVDGREKVVCET